MVGTMGAQLLGWMRQQSQPCGWFDFADSASFLEQRFGDGVEHLFNGVQREIDARNPGYSVYANVHRPCLIEAMRQWFAEIHRTHPATSYELFAANVVQPGDCVVTFNYDVSLDSNLRAVGKWNIGDGYGFRADGLPTGSAVKIFKVHGSINWFAVLFGGLMSGEVALPSGGALGHRPAFTDGDLTALGYDSTIQDPAFPRQGTAAIPPLILPTSRKQFFFQSNLGREWLGFWDGLWRSARRAVRNSDRVVLCGYGMSAIDRRGCNLLLTGDVSAQIEVCCGNSSEQIVQQLLSRGRNARIADQVFFQDWVVSQCQSRPS
jgi:hypothetical protein